MKKFAALILALSMIFLLCACGGSDKEEPEAEQAQPTEMPSVTAPPAGESGSDGMITADENNAPDAQLAQGSDLSSEEAQLALSLQGQDVSKLIEQIGEPKSREYTASCIAPDGGAEDGLLYYDGFTVSTLRYPNGSESIMGVF